MENMATRTQTRANPGPQQEESQGQRERRNRERKKYCLINAGKSLVRSVERQTIRSMAVSV